MKVCANAAQRENAKGTDAKGDDGGRGGEGEGLLLLLEALRREESVDAGSVEAGERRGLSY